MGLPADGLAFGAVMSGSAWHTLLGTPGYFAGASGTVTLPPSATLVRVWCRSTAGGTLTIFGGQSIPIIANAAPFDLDLKHALFTATSAGTLAQLVFTGTDSYFVHYVTN